MDVKNNPHLENIFSMIETVICGGGEITPAAFVINSASNELHIIPQLMGENAEFKNTIKTVIAAFSSDLVVMVNHASMVKRKIDKSAPSTTIEKIKQELMGSSIEGLPDTVEIIYFRVASKDGTHCAIMREIINLPRPHLSNTVEMLEGNEGSAHALLSGLFDFTEIEATRARAFLERISREKQRIIPADDEFSTIFDIRAPGSTTLH